MSRSSVPIVLALLCASSTALVGCSSPDLSAGIASALAVDGGAPDGGGGAPAIYAQPGPRREHTAWIEPASDGGAVVITEATGSPGPLLRTVTRLEADGRARWSHLLSCDKSDRGASAFVTDDGEVDVVVACSGVVSFPGPFFPTGSLPLFRLRDSDGSLIAYKPLDASGVVSPTVRVKSDKVYVVAFCETLCFYGGQRWDKGTALTAFSRDTGQLVFAHGNANWIGVAMDLEPAGGIWVGGRFRGTIDLGDGHHATAQGPEDAMLAHFTPDGRALSLRTFGDATFNSDAVNDVWVGDDGNAYVRGSATSGVSVGGAPLFPDGGLQVAFLASYDPTGAHRWSRAVPFHVERGTYLHGAHQIALLGRLPAAITGLFYSEAGVLDHTRELGSGSISSYSAKPTSFAGRLLYGGSFTTSATVFGVPLATTDEDAFAAIAAP